MPLVLARIDDRLVHGQVVVGWGTQIHPDRIILCNDEIAASEWEREIYLAAEATAPYAVTVSVMTQNETLSLLSCSSIDKEKVILLVESPSEMLTLIKKGLKVNKVNIGGMHFKQGKRRLANFIFVDDSDVQSFEQLYTMNIELEGRDVPSSKKTDIAKLLNFN